MSGINEIKKKAKLSIDEMYDNQSVEKLDIQEKTKPEIKQSSQTEIQPYYQTTKKEVTQKESYLESQKNGKKPVQLSGEPEIHINGKPDFQPMKTSMFSSSSKQQIQKAPTYKMTFNLTEEIYKAFNDLYANRMLRGRKTEKSEMICEAIQWLIKMEEEQAEVK
jgi:hypothetical protein